MGHGMHLRGVQQSSQLCIAFDLCTDLGVVLNHLCRAALGCNVMCSHQMQQPWEVESSCAHAESLSPVKHLAWSGPCS